MEGESQFHAQTLVLGRVVRLLRGFPHGWAWVQPSGLQVLGGAAPAAALFPPSGCLGWEPGGLCPCVPMSLSPHDPVSLCAYVSVSPRPCPGPTAPLSTQAQALTTRTHSGPDLRAGFAVLRAGGAPASGDAGGGARAAVSGIQPAAGLPGVRAGGGARGALPFPGEGERRGRGGAGVGSCRGGEGRGRCRCGAAGPGRRARGEAGRGAGAAGAGSAAPSSLRKSLPLPPFSSSPPTTWPRSRTAAAAARP